MNYQQQAIDFLKSTNTEMQIVFSHNGKHFEDDKEARDIYNVTIKRGSRKISFKFGNSLADSGFYASYGRTKYAIPYNKLNLTDVELRRFVKINLQYDFGNAKSDQIIRPKSPTEYSVLACLQKYDVGTFEDFCSEFGYDEDSKKAEKTYNAVVKEYDNVCKIWSDEEIEQLQEII